MNDKELDILFAETAQRQKAVEQINHAVMQTVRRDMRRKTIRKWIRMIAMCFGMPASIVLYIYAMATYMPEMPQAMRVVFYVMPLVTMAICFGKRLHDYSPFDM